MIVCQSGSVAPTTGEYDQYNSDTATQAAAAQASHEQVRRVVTNDAGRKPVSRHSIIATRAPAAVELQQVRLSASVWA